MARAVNLVLLFTLVWSSSVPYARAESESPEYKEAVNLGLAEFDDKNFREARVQFARAHSLEPSARTLRALGMVHFELKEYARSAQYLREALSSNERPLEADKREQAQKLLERAQSYVGRVAIDVAPNAQLLLDGQVVRMPTNHELMLDVGAHSLEFKAEGYVSERRTVKVEGGEAETLRVRLIAVDTVATRAPGDDTRSERRPVYKSPWLWTIVGVVAAGAAAGTAIALTSKTEKRQREPESGTPGVPIVMGLGE